MPLTTYSTLRLMVKSECNRGNTVDTVIDSKIQQAVTFIESNWTFLYMEQMAEQLNVTGRGPFAQPDNCKAIRAIKLVNIGADGAGTFKTLTKFDDGTDQGAITGGDPNHFLEDGRDWIWFDSTVPEPTDMQIFYDRFSGPFNDDSTSWLFDFGMSAVVSRTMMNFAPWLRQPGIFTAYNSNFQLDLKSLIVADQNARLKGTDVTYGMLAA